MRVEREVVVPATAAEVWAAVIDERRLAEWLGADAGADLEVDLTVEPGATGTVAEPGAPTRQVRVDVVDHERRVRFQWWPDDGRGPLSEVEISLTETGESTTSVRVTETLLAPAPAPPAPPARPVPPGRLGLAPRTPGMRPTTRTEERTLGFELRSRVLVGT